MCFVGSNPAMFLILRFNDKSNQSKEIANANPMFEIMLTNNSLMFFLD